MKADGTLLDGKEAEQELAKYDAKSILKELGLKEGTAGILLNENDDVLLLAVLFHSLHFILCS